MTAPVWMAAPPCRHAAIDDHNREPAPNPGIAAGRVETSARGVGTPVDFAGLASKVSGTGHPEHALIVKTIFSKLCRREKCGQRHNCSRVPVIGQNAEVRGPKGGRLAVVGATPGASTLSLCNANFSKLS
nr:hypothetical protein MFLOJ_30230 [Mycobacterium florentinum]